MTLLAEGDGGRGRRDVFSYSPPSHSTSPITVQLSISTIPCKTLNNLIPPVLFSPVFANPHLRPPALATSANLPPHPQSASSPSPLPVRRFYRPDRCDLRGLCVKISPPLHSDRPVQPSAALQMIDTEALQIAVLCHPMHQTANSRPLFSIACALFCNYGGGGGSPQLALSQRNRQHSQSLPSYTNAEAPQALSSRSLGGLPTLAGILFFSSPLPPKLPQPPLLPCLSYPLAHHRIPTIHHFPAHPNDCPGGADMLVFPLQKLAWPSASPLPAPRTFSPATLPI